MFRNRFNVALGIIGAAAAVSAAHAAWYARFDGVDGSCASTSSSLIETVVGDRSVMQWLIPEGSGEIVFRPSDENDDMPLESISLNYERTGATAPAVGSTVDIADDIWLDGRIITAAVSARWR